ncbi:MAG: hypothetical protein WDZ80_05150 [Candidatus Paceibacterota bacterium]
MAKLPIKTNIINLLEIDSVSFENKQEIIEKSTELIEQKSLNKVLESLDENNIDKFKELLENQNEEEIYDFLKQENIDLIKIIEEETKEVRKSILENLKELEN